MPRRLRRNTAVDKEEFEARLPTYPRLGIAITRNVRSSRAGWGFITESEVKEMGVFKRKVPRHYIPIHPDNIASKDWIVLLEAGTLVDSPEKLRVAMATTERRIVTKYNILLRKTCFLVVEGYDPRIHALYFCPQLYRLDSDGKPVALDGEEIGKMLAQSVRDGVVEKQAWYGPSETPPGDPVIAAKNRATFETLVVEESPRERFAA